MKRFESNRSLISVILIAGMSLLLSSFYLGKNGAHEPDKLVKLKVAAYNVEYGDKGSAHEIGLKLKPFGFDVVCFSEAPGGTWTREVADAMGLDHIVVGKYSTAGHEDKYKSIVSSTPLTDYEEVLMADTLHTATKAFILIDGKKIAIYSVHFPFGWRDQAHIDETTGKITALVNYIKSQPMDELPLVMGDFNFVLSTDDYQSPYYEMFVNIGLDASWRDLGTDVTHLSTLVGPSERDTRGLGRVIDHILYPIANITALEGEVIEMKKPLSDHKPVWALLEIK